ncbi:MAG: hypothetical protein ACRC7G_07950 [Beijerinckiaceae bacterium]
MPRKLPLLQQPLLRMALGFASAVLAGGALWFEIDARIDGFTGHFDRRAAHAVGVIDVEEWRGMQAARDVAPASAGADGCTGEACRAATALMAGRWTAGAGCNLGNRYAFSDGYAEVADLRDGRVIGTNRRRYRLVAAAADVPLRRDGRGRPLALAVTKRPGDLEVFTLGRQAFVRRIFRKVDADTVMLVLVENRVGRKGPADALYAESRSLTGGEPLFYQRCPDRG